MFVNDLNGLCRGNFFTGDVFNAGIPSVFNPFAQIPYGYNLNLAQTGFTGQTFHPTFGWMQNRVPSPFFNQGFVPQTLGNVNTITSHPYFPFVTSNVPFVNPMLGQSSFGQQFGGYGINPFTTPNWNWTSPLGTQSQICR